MKTNYSKIILTLLVAIFIFSCSKEDILPPEISNFEVGGAHHDEDHDGEDHDDEAHEEGIGHPGEELHIGADIIAYSKITSITIDIHSDEITPAAGEVVWEFEQVYTDQKYLVLNAELHEDIMVPANAALGEYHVILTVTDEAGNSTTEEEHFDLEEEEDHDHDE
jgi:hypothetical protein